MTHSFIVEDLKIRLDRCLANRISSVSRSQIQKDIEQGKVAVNGKMALEGKVVVRKDDAIVYRPSEKKDDGLKASNTPLKILYNDHGLLIIDKPAGMTVHPGAGFKGETLASALLYQFKNIHLVGEEHRPGIVHRLDKDTSGVILVALTQDMYEFLKDAFAERKIKKEYIALVKGRVEKPQGIINTPIGKSKTDFRKHTAKDPQDPKAAITEYKVLEYLNSARQPVSSSAGQQNTKAGVDGYTLVMVKLHTGRTHQIRVHFSSIGYPLMGDALYGPKKNQINGLQRQFLHAKKIEVQLPNGNWIEAESEFPADLKEVLVHLNSKVIKQL